MINLAEYEQQILKEENRGWLRKELLERMRVNVGLITENLELKRKLQRCEEVKLTSTALDITDESSHF